MTSRACEDLHELASAYALGALPPEDAARVEAYLALSPALAAEVQALTETAAALAASGRAEPSPALREQVLARVRATPQDPAPAADATNATSIAADAVSPSVRDIRSAPSVRAVGPAPPGGRARWLGPVAAVVAAASLVLAVASRGTIAELRRVAAARDSAAAVSAERLARREAQLNTILEADGALKVVMLAGDDAAGPGIQFYWNAKQNRGLIHAFRLPPAPAGKAYQFWVIRNGQPMSVRVFDSDPDGHALVENLALPASWEGVTLAAVTVEPAGGSPQPTTTPFLTGVIGD